VQWVHQTTHPAHETINKMVGEGGGTLQQLVQPTNMVMSIFFQVCAFLSLGHSRELHVLIMDQKQQQETNATK
jgi:hypothetical protein